MAHVPPEEWSLGPIQWSRDKETAERYHDYLTELIEHKDKGIGMGGLPLGKYAIHIGENLTGTMAESLPECFEAPTSIEWPGFPDPINKIREETIVPMIRQLADDLHVPMCSFQVYELYYKEEDKSRMMVMIDIRNRADVTQAIAEEFVQRGTESLRAAGVKDIYVRLTAGMSRQWW